MTCTHELRLANIANSLPEKILLAKQCVFPTALPFGSLVHFIAGEAMLSLASACGSPVVSVKCHPGSLKLWAPYYYFPDSSEEGTTVVVVGDGASTILL